MGYSLNVKIRWLGQSTAFNSMCTFNSLTVECVHSRTTVIEFVYELRNGNK